MSISDNAVGAAVGTLSPRWFYHAPHEVWRQLMRGALEAAAAHIRAQVLEELAAAARDDMALGQRLYVAQWIRGRAEMSQTPNDFVTTE